MENGQTLCIPPNIVENNHLHTISGFVFNAIKTLSFGQRQTKNQVIRILSNEAHSKFIYGNHYHQEKREREDKITYFSTVV